jgi:hypothetical protein
LEVTARPDKSSFKFDESFKMIAVCFKLAAKLPEYLE